MMRLFRQMLLIAAGSFIWISAFSQNAMINILTQNAGIVKKGENVFLEVTVNNTDPAAAIGIYKIQTQISVPSSIVSIAAKGHKLPAGWTITSSNDSTIRFSNGEDSIAPLDARTLLIAVEGIKTGGPSTIIGQLSFSNGEAPGTAPGVLNGDNPADNSSATTVTVNK